MKSEAPKETVSTEKVEPKAQEETTPTEAVKSEAPKETVSTEEVEPKAQEEISPTKEQNPENGG